MFMYCPTDLLFLQPLLVFILIYSFSHASPQAVVLNESSLYDLVEGSIRSSSDFYQTVETNVYHHFVSSKQSL